MNFEEVMHEERKKLNAQIDELEAEKAKLDEQIAQVRQELKAIDAYEKAKYGTPTTTASTGKRRTGVRKEVLEIINQHPNGITRQALLSQMGADDKKSQQSISNALANLKKAGEIHGESGTYSPINQTTDPA